MRKKITKFKDFYQYIKSSPYYPHILYLIEQKKNTYEIAKELGLDYKGAYKTLNNFKENGIIEIKREGKVNKMTFSVTYMREIAEIIDRIRFQITGFQTMLEKEGNIEIVKKILLCLENKKVYIHDLNKEFPISKNQDDYYPLLLPTMSYLGMIKRDNDFYEITPLGKHMLKQLRQVP